MKVMVGINNYSGMASGFDTGWRLLCDSAVTNTGKPFYLPEVEGKVTASPALAIKITRLGKNISPKFAHKYYSECAPAIIFACPDMALRLRKEGKSDDPAFNFDKALFVGEFSDIKAVKDLKLLKNNKKVSEFSLQNIIKNPEEFIGLVSCFNTLKMGDLILPATGEETEVSIGETLRLEMGESFAFNVRIK